MVPDPLVTWKYMVCIAVCLKCVASQAGISGMLSELREAGINRLILFQGRG
jgi:hypothetical protein